MGAVINLPGRREQGQRPVTTGWRVLRFAWRDEVERPEAVVTLVRRAPAPTRSGDVSAPRRGSNHPQNDGGGA